jgi:putative flippase GtrA
MNQNTLTQFFKYLLVGGLSALLDTSCLYVLYTYFGLDPLLAGAIGFLIGVVSNYIMSIIWVFESSGNVKTEFTLFAIIGIGGLLWTELILWILIDITHVPVMASKLVALALVLIWNFGMRKKFVFSSMPHSSNSPIT